MDILEDLKYRGLIYQASNLQGLKKELKKGKIVVYCGFDPTASSLHIGNLLLILALRRFQLAGHQPIALVGGATGLIGDPSWRLEERKLKPDIIIKQWERRIKKQLEKILDFSGPKNPAILANNYDWHGKMNALDFLRDLGKHFTIPYLLSREGIKSRLEKGLSFAEFSYTILQAFDFYHLNKKYNCMLQIGGSDQWGNIISGVDLMKKAAQKEVFVLTLPLITTPSGEKLGKSAGNAVWLDPELTSPYQFYQFWMNVDDRSAVEYLKFFTFLTKEEIEKLAQQAKEQPEKRETQKILAFEVTKIVHGAQEAKSAKKISEALFYGKVQGLSLKELEAAFQGAPSFILKKTKNISLVDLLIKAGVSSSKRQAREDIQNKIININGRVFDGLNQVLTRSICLFKRYLVIKRGKKNYHLVSWLN